MINDGASSGLSSGSSSGSGSSSVQAYKKDKYFQ